MEIKGFLGMEGRDFVFEQDGLDYSHCFGDMIWAGHHPEFNCDVLLVAEWISDEDFEEWVDEFEIKFHVAARIKEKLNFY